MNHRAEACKSRNCGNYRNIREASVLSLIYGVYGTFVPFCYALRKRQEPGLIPVLQGKLEIFTQRESDRNAL
ncbi:MAG: hypothetical protein V4495_09545 [Pseudomonadota bacterium]